MALTTVGAILFTGTERSRSMSVIEVLSVVEVWLNYHRIAR